MNTKLRKLIPFPKRKTLQKWFPPFPVRNTAHLITQSGAEMVIDIGANIGQFVEKMRAAGCTLPMISFEPIESCHDTLMAKATKIANWTIAPRLALGKETGFLTLHKLRDTSLSSSLRPLKSEGRPENIDILADERVPLTTLDAILPSLTNASRLFIKLDVQGTEKDVLAGAADTLKKCVGLSIELSFNQLYEGETGYLDMLHLLDTLGFYPVYVSPVLNRQKLGPIAQIDMVLYRKERP